VSGALFPPGSARRTKRAVILTVAVLVVAVAVCGGGSVLAANLLGLVGCEPKPAYVSEVQDDVRRVSALFPALAVAKPSAGPSGGSSGPGDGSASARPSASQVPSGIVTVHYQFRDARKHTCPEISPVLTIYDGFAELTPARADALKTEYQFGPGDAPSVPNDLQKFAPANAAWQRSDALDKAANGKVWFDAASRTAFFTYLTN
jgi:hypothetical protein